MRLSEQQIKFDQMTYTWQICILYCKVIYKLNSVTTYRWIEKTAKLLFCENWKILKTTNYFVKVEEKSRVENFIVSENKRIDVLAFADINKTIPSRQIAVSHQTVWKILERHKFKGREYQINQTTILKGESSIGLFS